MTDIGTLAEVIRQFEERLPGFWWSVGHCRVGAHASCGVDRDGVQSHLLRGASAKIFDDGFHCDTNGGQAYEAIQDVMKQALAALSTHSR